MGKVVFLAVVTFAWAAFTGVTNLAAAQNTGGVFPATVNDGHRSAQYRIGFNPDTEAMAQRLHYQQSINGDLMWRVVGQGRKTNESDVDFDFIQGELFWQITEDNKPWITGLRFDARIRDDGRPGQFGVNWMHQFRLGDGWSARAVALTSIELGDDAKDGIALQTRGQIAKRLNQGPTVGIELYSSYGRSDNIRDFEDQSHTMGPYVSAKIGDKWSLIAGGQFGLTNGSADTDLRLWITRSF